MNAIKFSHQLVEFVCFKLLIRHMSILSNGHKIMCKWPEVMNNCQNCSYSMHEVHVCINLDQNISLKMNKTAILKVNEYAVTWELKL